ncbi:MAG: hypothetical protein GXP31_00300 [Kiritimatiellaeota bacterium]|nr:hypothetical protein [Kiritimatiellota bacterium]
MKYSVPIALIAFVSCPAMAAQANLARAAHLVVDSHLGALRPSLLVDGKRGRQSRQTYWNDGTQGRGGDVVRLVWDKTRMIQEVRLLAPIMDRGGPYRLSGIEIQLRRGGKPLVTVMNLAMVAAPTLVACRDPVVKLAEGVAVDEMRVTFGNGNRDGWNFCGEIVVLGPGQNQSLLSELAAQDGHATPMDFTQSVIWLEAKARELVRASQRDMANGVHAFPPQVGPGYNAFWLRDYSYMIETCADALTEKELVDACRLFADAVREDGAGVDCVRFSGEPVYKPGMGTMGRNPVADGGQFTVNVAWVTWRRTRDRNLLNHVLPALCKTLEAVPRNPATGLVHITPGEGRDRCPYGFTDTIGKQGDVLFCSLLYIQASRRLADLLRAAGQVTAAESRDKEAEKLVARVRSTFWDPKTGLFRAATVRCREPDIWGSAFAVYLNVASEPQARSVGVYFRDHYAEICQRGQVRHRVYWERGCKRDTYQNGAFWAVPTGWFVHALAPVAPELARRTVLDLVRDFHERGICEWTIGARTRLPNYVASATLPLQGIRELAGQPVGVRR